MRYRNEVLLASKRTAPAGGIDSGSRKRSIGNVVALGMVENISQRRVGDVSQLAERPQQYRNPGNSGIPCMVEAVA